MKQAPLHQVYEGPTEEIVLDVDGLRPRLDEVNGLLRLQVPVEPLPEAIFDGAKQLLGEGADDDDIEYLCAKLARVARTQSLRVFLSKRIK
jgi:hypothetical protein